MQGILVIVPLGQWNTVKHCFWHSKQRNKQKMYQIEKNQIIPCFFQAVFFFTKKTFFSEKKQHCFFRFTTLVIGLIEDVCCYLWKEALESDNIPLQLDTFCLRRKNVWYERKKRGTVWLVILGYTSILECLA